MDRQFRAPALWTGITSVRLPNKNGGFGLWPLSNDQLSVEAAVEHQFVSGLRRS